jgi:hypothetical protein
VHALTKEKARKLIPLEALEWYLNVCREEIAALKASPVKPSEAALRFANAVVSDCEAIIQTAREAVWEVTLSEYAEATDRTKGTLRVNARSGELLGADRYSRRWSVTNSASRAGLDEWRLIESRHVVLLATVIHKRREALRVIPELVDRDTLALAETFAEIATRFADSIPHHGWFVRLRKLVSKKSGKLRKSAARGKVVGARKLGNRWYRFSAPWSARA